jgi:hypothetical protein
MSGYIDISKEKSSWEFTKKTSNYHFDPKRMDPRYDTVIGLARFEGDWDAEVQRAIERAKPMTWRSRRFGNISDTSPMVEAEEYDIIQGGGDPNVPMWGVTDMKKDMSDCPVLSRIVDIVGLDPAELKAKIHVQFTGESHTLHIDKLAQAFSPDGINYVGDDEHLITRIVVMLQDWEPGHFYQYGNYTYEKWHRGDCHTFLWKDVPHCTANAGLVPRVNLLLTGKITDKTREFYELGRKQPIIYV